MSTRRPSQAAVDGCVSHETQPSAASPAPYSYAEPSSDNPHALNLAQVAETVTASVSQGTTQTLAASEAADSQLWRGIRWLHDHSVLPSVQCCRRSTLNPSGYAAIEVTDSGGARYSGLKTCGSVWSCPMCSLRTWAKRAQQLERTMAAAHLMGDSATLLTLTMRHKKGDTLLDLWKALSSAWNRLNSDREVRRLREGSNWVGYVRRVEVTHGENGWHIHIHCIDFWEELPTSLPSYSAACFDAWSLGLTKRGLAAPKKAVGADLRLLDLASSAAEVASYVTARARSTESSLSLELTDAVNAKQAKKGNRTPWAILAGAVGGSERDRRLWAVWERGSKGKRALHWSKAVRERYGALEESMDIDAPLEPETPVLWLAGWLWRELLQTACPSHLLKAAELGFWLAENEGCAVPERHRRAQREALTWLDAQGFDLGGVVLPNLDDVPEPVLVSAGGQEVAPAAPDGAG